MRPSFRASLLAGLALASVPASAANLEVATGYRMRALRYTNLDLRDPQNNHSFISQNASLAVSIKNIELKRIGGEDAAMDVGFSLRGVGVAGSTTTQRAPFDRIASHYPNSNFVPYIETAFVRARGLFGRPMEWTFGQQAFTLGSGLLLADDGVGLTGVSVSGPIAFWDMKWRAFTFQTRHSQADANSLMVYGAQLEVPTEGTWQLHYLAERDKAQQTAARGLPVNAANRHFLATRYQISFGPLLFDGEAALQRGSAIPPGPTAGNPDGTRITYNGNAQVIKAKWKQSFWKGGEGIARLTVARGSGDSGGTPTTDEAFFPSRGHRYDGLERSGFGDFFGATPYDAFGGYSTSTAGLGGGASGVQAVGLGFTPPAYRGIIVDFDYWVFQADRNTGAHRTLGTELDLKFRYQVRDRFSVQATYAAFNVGAALNPAKGSARRYMLEAQGRF